MNMIFMQEMKDESCLYKYKMNFYLSTKFMRRQSEKNYIYFNIYYFPLISHNANFHCQ